MQIQMRRQTVTIRNKLGLHARAAARLVRLAGGYRSDIRLARVDAPVNVVDAKSIFGVLLLAATQNIELEVSAAGEDEEAAINAVCSLIENDRGEQ